MSCKQKAKFAGKIIIIVLSMAILFFLLLPFLENPAASEASKGKKASPQIFTSNPLSDLVQKVYALFKRDNPPAPVYSEEIGEEMFASLTPEEQQRFAHQRAEEEQTAQSTNFEYSDEAAAVEAYGDAGIINEEGEWILVRQTAPESATPGMHEVSTRDNAYERHLRQERAERYIGKAGAAAAAAPAIPDSKWARLWKPIKSFFTGTDDKADAPSSSANTAQEKAPLLASSSALGKDTHKQGSTYQKGKSADMSASEWELGSGADTNPIYNLLSPKSTLKDIADSYIKTAQKSLNGQQLKNYEQKVNAYIQEHQQTAEQEETDKNWEKLMQVAQGQSSENLVEKTIHSGCAGEGEPAAPQSLYSTQQVGEASSCSSFDYKNAKEVGANNMRILKEKLSPQAQQAFEKQPLSMIVLLGKTEENPYEKAFQEKEKNLADILEWNEAGDGFLTEEEKQQKLQRDKEIVAFVMQQQGCAQDSCYWVSGTLNDNQNVETKATVLNAGFEYMGDPLNIAQKTIAQYAQQNNLSLSDEQINALVNEYFKYVPYNAQNMQELNQRNQAESNEKFLYFVPHAIDAVNMQEVLPNPSHIVYDNSQYAAEPQKEILDYSSHEDDGERGMRLLLQTVERMSEVHQLKHETNEFADIHQFCMTELLKEAGEDLQKEMENSKTFPFKIIDL